MTGCMMEKTYKMGEKIMKNNKRRAKGITLIALVITIIILLLLAGVTISAIVNGGLITRAN